MRTIAIVTSSRADYGHLYWVLKELPELPGVRMRLMVMGSHLSPEFGHTVDVIEKDGFQIHDRIECLMSSDTDVGMAKTLGLAMLSFAERFEVSRPDLLLLIADRYEMLAPASAAMAMRIPIAHIEGGERSEGAIDQVVRNALTAMSHLHFAATQAATRRIVQMGEEPWRVHHVGAPSLDFLRRADLLTQEELEQKIQMDLYPPPLIVSFHPVTLEDDPAAEAEALFAALEDYSDSLAFCFPNADAGGRAIRTRATRFCQTKANAKMYVNLEPLLYWSLMKHAIAIIGNSSSGIMEAPSLALPAVDIGRRQEGRELASNVIRVPAEVGAIRSAIDMAVSQDFRRSLIDLENPYGDGHASERIAQTLAQTPLGQTLLHKKHNTTDQPLIANT